VSQSPFAAGAPSSESGEVADVEAAALSPDLGDDLGESGTSDDVTSDDVTSDDDATLADDDVTLADDAATPADDASPHADPLGGSDAPDPGYVSSGDGDDDEGATADDLVTGAPVATDGPSITDEAEEEVDEAEELRASLRRAPGDWYVIHSYAGYENRVKANLENRIGSLNMEDFIFQIEVPTEEVTEVKNGQRKLVKRVRMPGYVLVRMDLTDESWGAVRNTPGVTGFVGHTHQPVPSR
jgi:transcriptional antiterminator NusG